MAPRSCWSPCDCSRKWRNRYERAFHWRTRSPRFSLPQDSKGRTSLIPTSEQIGGLLATFAPHCRDQTTFRALQAMAANRRRWKQGYALFERIRSKTLRAEQRHQLPLQLQYYFEEICAKTFYNMSIPPERAWKAYPPPFDEDSVEYILPIAQDFASYLGLPPIDLDAMPTLSPAVGSRWQGWGIQAKLARMISWMRG